MSPAVTHRDAVAPLARFSLLVSFALFMVLLGPLYLANKLHFRQMIKSRPLAASLLVRAQQRWPILYEAAMLFQNFPLYDAVYARIAVDGERILQVGCGTGLFNRYLRRTSGRSICNVEPHAAAVALAKRWGRLIDASCLSITERLPYPDKSFDQIIFARSFHHIHRHRKAFIECARLLAPGGRIVVFDPVIVDGYAARDEAWIGNSSIDGLIWRYTASSLAALIARNLPEGLTIERVETDRIGHLTNFNLIVPQTDAIVTIRKKEE
jgi:SAM-dependent methyltransferase